MELAATEGKFSGFIKNVSKQVRIKLWSVVYSAHLNSDDVLFWQGDVGNAFYILLKGCVKVYVNENIEGSGSGAAERAHSMVMTLKSDSGSGDDSDDSEGEIVDLGVEVATLMPGQRFGEMALIGAAGSRRAASIICAHEEESHLLVVPEAYYKQLLMEMDQQKNGVVQKLQLMHEISFFQHLSTAPFNRIAYSAGLESHVARKVIARKGEEIQSIFFVIDGSISMCISQGGWQKEHVCNASITLSSSPISCAHYEPKASLLCDYCPSPPTMPL